MVLENREHICARFGEKGGGRALVEEKDLFGGRI